MKIIDVSDGFLALMDDNGETREDLKVPDGDLGKEIEKKFGGGEQFMVSFWEDDWPLQEFVKAHIFIYLFIF